MHIQHFITSANLFNLLRTEPQVECEVLDFSLVKVKGSESLTCYLAQYAHISHIYSIHRTISRDSFTAAFQAHKDAVSRKRSTCHLAFDRSGTIVYLGVTPQVIPFVHNQSFTIKK
jgi:hypothetical protein